MIEWVSRALGTMRTEQRGSSTVYDEGSQVDIALLGDFSEPALLCTRALVGRKAQPGREVTARRWISPTMARSAVLVSAPMPGIWRNCWTRTSWRVRALS